MLVEARAWSRSCSSSSSSSAFGFDDEKRQANFCRATQHKICRVRRVFRRTIARAKSGALESATHPTRHCECQASSACMVPLLGQGGELRPQARSGVVRTVTGNTNPSEIRTGSHHPRGTTRPPSLRCRIRCSTEEANLSVLYLTWAARFNSATIRCDAEAKAY